MSPGLCTFSHTAQARAGGSLEEAVERAWAGSCPKYVPGSRPEASGRSRRPSSSKRRIIQPKNASYRQLLSVLRGQLLPKLSVWALLATAQLDGRVYGLQAAAASRPQSHISTVSARGWPPSTSPPVPRSRRSASSMSRSMNEEQNGVFPESEACRSECPEPDPQPRCRRTPRQLMSLCPRVVHAGNALG